MAEQIARFDKSEFCRYSHDVSEWQLESSILTDIIILFSGHKKGKTQWPDVPYARPERRKNAFEQARCCGPRKLGRGKASSKYWVI